MQIFKNVANIEEAIKMLQCCHAFKVLRMFQCFLKKSLRTLQVLGGGTGGG